MTGSLQQDYKERVIQEDIYNSDCGYFVFGPTTHGYFTAYDLRIIADYLDEINKPWDHTVRNGLCNRCGKAKEMSRTLDQDGMVYFYDCDCEVTGEVNESPSEIPRW